LLWLFGQFGISGVKVLNQRIKEKSMGLERDVTCRNVFEKMPQPKEKSGVVFVHLRVDESLQTSEHAMFVVVHSESNRH